MQTSEVNADRRKDYDDNDDKRTHGGVQEDSDGRFIDEYSSNYRYSHHDIKSEVDKTESEYGDSLRVHGLTEEEWKLK
jgi:hypothetical protein